MSHPGEDPILYIAKSGERTNPGECHILENATFWKTPPPGERHILEMPNAEKEQIMENATSWKTDLFRCRAAQMLGNARSWVN